MLPLVVFGLGSGGYRAYDRMPKNFDCTKFESEDRSRKMFSALLELYGLPPLGIKDSCLMLDVPFGDQILELRSQIASTVDHGLIEIPQTDLHPQDRGVFRSYLLLFRGQNPVPLDSVLVVKTRLHPRLELKLEKKR